MHLSIYLQPAAAAGGGSGGGVLLEGVAGVLEVLRHGQVAEQRDPGLGDLGALLPRRRRLLPQLHLPHLASIHKC